MPDLFAPVAALANWLAYDLVGLAADSLAGRALSYFVYDTIKIFLLLVAINYLMAVLRYYLPIEKMRDLLTSRRWYGLDYFLAALLGVITPFCSCSSIPLFIGFVSAGIPLGITFTFLITSPLINEASLVVMWGMFGSTITLSYLAAGIGVGVLGGWLMSRLKPERFVDESLLEMLKISPAKKNLKATGGGKPVRKAPFRELQGRFWAEGWQITKTILPYVIVGVGIGSLIHGFVPAGALEAQLADSSWWSVPAAAILAVPLYANSVAVLPIIQAFVEKGVPLGTALAFMMATVGLSLPEAMILRRAIRLPGLIWFFGIVTAGIITIGWLFNYFF